MATTTVAEKIATRIEQRRASISTLNETIAREQGDLATEVQKRPVTARRLLDFASRMADLESERHAQEELLRELEMLLMASGGSLDERTSDSPAPGIQVAPEPGIQVAPEPGILAYIPIIQWLGGLVAAPGISVGPASREHIRTACRALGDAIRAIERAHLAARLHREEAAQENC